MRQRARKSPRDEAARTGDCAARGFRSSAVGSPGVRRPQRLSWHGCAKERPAQPAGSTVADTGGFRLGPRQGPAVRRMSLAAAVHANKWKVAYIWIEPGLVNKIGLVAGSVHIGLSGVTWKFDSFLQVELVALLKRQHVFLLIICFYPW